MEKLNNKNVLDFRKDIRNLSQEYINYIYNHSIQMGVILQSQFKAHSL